MQVDLWAGRKGCSSGEKEGDVKRTRDRGSVCQQKQRQNGDYARTVEASSGTNPFQALGGSREYLGDQGLGYLPLLIKKPTQPPQ